MKKIFIPILILLAGFVFTGCDDLLDAVPKDRLSADTFFKSESELQAYSIGFYELFPTSELYVANDDHFTQNNMSNEGMGKRTIPASGSGWSWAAAAGAGRPSAISTPCWRTSATARTSRSVSSIRPSPVSSAPTSISPRSSASATSRGMTSPWAPRTPRNSTSPATAAS